MVPPLLKGPRSRVVVSADEGGSGQLVALAGVGDLNLSSKLVGRVLLARLEDLPANADLLDVDNVMGREVVDESMGSLGHVSEVMVGPANDVWTIDGPYGEVMFPVVDEFVRGMDDDGAVHVSVPEGLVGQEGEHEV